MHWHLDKYPPAEPGREAHARDLFPYRDVTAEEYAAREGANWLCFSFGNYVYSDPELNEWIHTLDDVFFTPGRMDEVRQEWLTPEELAAVRARTDEDF